MHSAQHAAYLEIITTSSCGLRQIIIIKSAAGTKKAQNMQPTKSTDVAAIAADYKPRRPRGL
jgi:hypothetical protein